jgi:hypothetical protein
MLGPTFLQASQAFLDLGQFHRLRRQCAGGREHAEEFDDAIPF